MTNNNAPANATENTPTPELSRDLSLFHITMMGLGMMIGAGVFLGMGISIGKSGPGGVVLTFALNGLLAMLTAMSFAELSSAIPRAGGAYNFARIGFGRGTSFLAGWMEWFASSVAGAMYALTFALYTIRFFSQMGFLDWFYALFDTTVGGIRTPGTLRFNGFQDRRDQPLCHSSSSLLTRYYSSCRQLKMPPVLEIVQAKYTTRLHI